jgi:replication initiation and membrane attachment protein DnaB
MKIVNYKKKTEMMKISEVDKVKIDFKAMVPEEYVESLTGNKTSFIVSRLIKELKTDYQLSNEIINCLINYSVLKNNSKIVERYILKIADTLVKKKITNLEDVMEYLKNAHAYTMTKDEEISLNEDVTRFDYIENELSFSKSQTKEKIELPEPNKYFIL